LKNTEVSRLRGELWRKASEDDKKPHIEKEKHERGKYKIAIAQWREKFEAKVEEQRKRRVEQAVNWGQSYNQEGGDGPNPQMPHEIPTCTRNLHLLCHHPNTTNPTDIVSIRAADVDTCFDSSRQTHFDCFSFGSVPPASWGVSILSNK
jgi:hypothetical protein